LAEPNIEACPLESLLPPAGSLDLLVMVGVRSGPKLLRTPHRCSTQQFCRCERV